MAGQDEITEGKVTSQDVTGWRVKALSDEKQKVAYVDWNQAVGERPHMAEGSSMKDIEDEAK